MDNIKTTSIPGLLILERPLLTDERGFYREIFRNDDVERLSGVKFNGIQLNHSRSKPGVIRGIHAEEWDKIIYPVSGEVFIAIVDVRPDSPTFGKVETFEVSDDNRIGFFIPNGLEIKIGQDNIRDRINILSNLLIQLRDELGNIKYIDLRFKEPVIKLNSHK